MSNEYNNMTDEMLKESILLQQKKIQNLETKVNALEAYNETLKFDLKESETENTELGKELISARISLGEFANMAKGDDKK